MFYLTQIKLNQQFPTLVVALNLSPQNDIQQSPNNAQFN